MNQQESSSLALLVLLLTLAGMVTTGLFFGYVRQSLLLLLFWLTLTATALGQAHLHRKQAKRQATAEDWRGAARRRACVAGDLATHDQV